MTAFILHVEDDPMLGAVVAFTFENLGFHSKTITAETVHKGEQILAEAARDGRTFDLILSDMHLPDGTGLDLVRYVRGNDVWKTTPMLILSGDNDPLKVGQAYALGANAYVSKSPPGRSLDEVIRVLYEHWMVDVVSARTNPDTTTDVLQRAINMRLRYAGLYQRLADRFADDPSESSFWLSRVLNESNLTNVLGFVQRQLADHELEAQTVGDVNRVQYGTELAIAALNRDLDRLDLSRDEIYLRVLHLTPVANLEAIARSMALLFPVIPVAVTTLRDFLLGSIQHMSEWLEQHATSPAVKETAVLLRDSSQILRQYPPSYPAGAPKTT